MSEQVQTEVVLEIFETILEGEPAGEGDTFIRVLRPGGTRDFPNGGRITVTNNAATAGKFSYRLGDGATTEKHITAGRTDNFQALQAFYLKNTGTVDLEVTP